VSTAHDPSWYEIRIQGHLDERWASWFDGMDVEPQPGGITTLRGAVVDQTALHGLLARLRDLGLPLVSITSGGAEPGPGGGHDTESRSANERAER
jgi:hypothetical protein